MQFIISIYYYYYCSNIPIIGEDENEISKGNDRDIAGCILRWRWGWAKKEKESKMINDDVDDEKPKQMGNEVFVFITT